MPESYLLDTGVLLGLITDTRWSQRTLEEFNLNDERTTVLTSIVSRGEITKLAVKRNWGERKLAKMDMYLRAYHQINIESSQIIDAYAKIGAWSEGADVVIAPNLASPPKPAIRMTENDLWIAATAHRLNLRLLSTDKDFDHLDQIWINYTYIDPINR